MSSKTTMPKLLTYTLKLTVLILTCLSMIYAENSLEIQGYITDTEHLPIPYANIQIKELGIGAAADNAGKFIIKVDTPGQYNLTISHVGFMTQKSAVTVPQENNLAIQLEKTFVKPPTVLVTATRTPKLMENVPVVTEVISAAQIQDSNSDDLSSLLSNRAGVYLTGSVSGGSVLSILGMDSKYILVLIDGQPVTGKFNSRVAFDQIPTHSIERVEIVKGPNSSLYGSEAMGGVINVITKKDHQPQLSVDLKFSGERQGFNPLDTSDGNRKLALNYKQNISNFDIQLDGQLQHINVEQTNDYIDLDEVLKAHLSNKTHWLLNPDQEITANLSWFKNLEDSHSSTMDTDTEIDRYQVSVLHQLRSSQNWEFSQFFRIGDYQRRYQQIYPWGEVKTDDITREKDLELELLANYSSEGNTFNTGLEFSQGSYESDRITGGEQVLDFSSFYLQYDTHFGDNLNFVLGSRLDYNSEVDLVHSPRLALMYTMNTRWKIRAMWGQGFRMPTFMDRYIDWYHYQFGYHVIGNPDLEPETSTGYSFGLEYYHPGVYRVSTTFYSTRFKDMIDDYILPESGYLSYRNIDAVQYNSIELQGTWNVSDSWIAGWGFNWVSNLDEMLDEPLPNTQEYSANVYTNQTLLNKKFRYSVRLKWIGPYTPMEYIPLTNEYLEGEKDLAAQYHLDITLNYKIRPNLQLETAVSNLTDYTNEKYGPFIGRVYSLSLNWKMKEID